MECCQNCGPFSGALQNAGPNGQGTQKRSGIHSFTTVHVRVLDPAFGRNGKHFGLGWHLQRSLAVGSVHQSHNSSLNQPDLSLDQNVLKHAARLRNLTFACTRAATALLDHFHPWPLTQENLFERRLQCVQVPVYPALPASARELFQESRRSHSFSPHATLSLPSLKAFPSILSSPPVPHSMAHCKRSYGTGFFSRALELTMRYWESLSPMDRRETTLFPACC